jgi:hypothetical protein
MEQDGKSKHYLPEVQNAEKMSYDLKLVSLSRCLPTSTLYLHL